MSQLKLPTLFSLSQLADYPALVGHSSGLLVVTRFSRRAIRVNDQRRTAQPFHLDRPHFFEQSALGDPRFAIPSSPRNLFAFQ